MRRVVTFASAGLSAAVIALALQPAAHAQWIRYKTAGIPRLPNGKPNLSAPAPKTADGHPDFSGVWLTGNAVPCSKASGADFLDCGIELPIAKEGINFGIELPGGLPYQPWAAELVKKRTAENSRDDPHARCLPDTFLRAYGLPHMMKFLQSPGLLVQIDEWNTAYRQIYTDNRPLPQDPTPSWNGYSSGKWVGDALVVTTIGFRDDLWLDLAGSFLTSAAKVTEEFRRPDLGHLEIKATVDDPKAYTKPWTVTLRQALQVDTDLVDETCLENEKSSQRLK